MISAAVIIGIIYGLRKRNQAIAQKLLAQQALLRNNKGKSRVSLDYERYYLCILCETDNHYLFHTITMLILASLF